MKSTPTSSDLKTEKQGVRLAVMVFFVMPLVLLCEWQWYEWRDRAVESSQPIGYVRGAIGDGASMMVEVADSPNPTPGASSLSHVFYPLKTPRVIKQGEALTLQVRKSGKRFLCDAAGENCSETSK